MPTWRSITRRAVVAILTLERNVAQELSDVMKFCLVEIEEWDHLY